MVTSPMFSAGLRLSKGCFVVFYIVNYFCFFFFLVMISWFYAQRAKKKKKTKTKKKILENRDLVFFLQKMNKFIQFFLFLFF